VLEWWLYIFTALGSNLLKLVAYILTPLVGILCIVSIMLPFSNSFRATPFKFLYFTSLAVGWAGLALIGYGLFTDWTLVNFGFLFTVLQMFILITYIFLTDWPEAKASLKRQRTLERETRLAMTEFHPAMRLVEHDRSAHGRSD